MAKFNLPELPFAKNALEPHISERTLEFHYGKHHQTYVNTLNTLIEGTEFENKTLEEIIKSSDGGIFNNAAQVWNHTFYWNCLAPNHKPAPEGSLKKAIEEAFGSFENFKEEFTKKSVGLFGSGWCWLVKDSAGKLSIVQQSNAGNPMTKGLTPIMVCDVWEHAYYLDKQNARPKYMESYWELVNWDFIEKQY
ncbi:MAG: Fe-Mn family superoxide dismutase [Synergistales bacterium]|nr:superoxide dismutase [Bacteroidales bacterium]MDY6435532.1 Fe-Mn family superoxide dismutase [Synergistales bacterium]MDY6382138.1 Fe-Mn family superoxide dismutase [Bacteroidales bacterium]MDY6394134.1 Fe-Mn family superoxide dismutase [Bacteroidales bacterium]MDY6395419.1 Fe-Mn family superoxide dismutase [Bacteroidales bacterium]